MVRARGRHLSHSRRKVAPVVALIRGRSVADALTILEHTPRRPAPIVAEVVKSARANAERNHRYRPETLMIETIYVTSGRRLNRWRRRHRQVHRTRPPQPYQRQTCHLEVVLSGQRRPQPAKMVTDSDPKPTAKKKE